MFYKTGARLNNNKVNFIIGGEPSKLQVFENLISPSLNKLERLLRQMFPG